MHLITIVLLLGVVGLFTCSEATVGSFSPPQTATQVVRDYVSLARQGRFEKLESLTVLRPTKTLKESIDSVSENTHKGSNTKSNNGLMIVPDEKVFAEAVLEWVRLDFAKSIRDGGLSIESIRSESVEATEARVEIVLRNEKTINLLGWVFLLRKVEDKWKIYDITTPSGAPKDSPEI